MFATILAFTRANGTRTIRIIEGNCMDAASDICRRSSADIFDGARVVDWRICLTPARDIRIAIEKAFDPEWADMAESQIDNFIDIDAQARAHVEGNYDDMMAAA
ncbi:hypothetical protein [Consotaella salsifontis]|uniref:Uncharacterized protein n=1 Tax=Consotaella salsifontis TaxID=1365950 RepID=A0A1T4SS25_9HYPH|nr:hypothetical protein [Consotaella salsifontis]SKA31110.1 hypothetical protein SAMN05428963_113118 [Consotaella salsifontis]